MNPNCGYREPHIPGQPCSEKMCPKCGSRMKTYLKIKNANIISVRHAKSFAGNFKDSLMRYKKQRRFRIIKKNF